MKRKIEQITELPRAGPAGYKIAVCIMIARASTREDSGVRMVMGAAASGVSVAAFDLCARGVWKDYARTRIRGNRSCFFSLRQGKSINFIFLESGESIKCAITFFKS